LFATLRVGSSAPSNAHVPEKLRHIEPLVAGPVKVSREVRLGFTLGMKPGVEFTINREQHHRADPVRVGELQVNVPAFGSVRIAWMPDDRPGEWMYHCHILEHHAASMMAHFEVVR
jgi:hypothetical protein